MPGYVRGTQRAALSREEIGAEVASFIGEREIAAVLADADPFLIGFACEWSATGCHVPIASCGEVVCAHCAKIFWR